MPSSLSVEIPDGPSSSSPRSHPRLLRPEEGRKSLRSLPPSPAPTRMFFYNPNVVQDRPPPIQIPLDDDPSRKSSAQRTPHARIVLRRPTVVEDHGLGAIENIEETWDGVPISAKEEEGKATKPKGEKQTWSQKTVKYTKILIPHITLVAVLIAYLSFGAWILMHLETNAELQNRSRKLVKITNMISNFSGESWQMLNDAQKGVVPPMEKDEWARQFREYAVAVTEAIDERRPIRKELASPGDLDSMHNKWTFPTSLLYMLTVLTICGYNEVSVDTDAGKIFAISFAFVGIPLMFITAADIGKFLSTSFIDLIGWYQTMERRVKHFVRKSSRRFSMAVSQMNSSAEAIELLAGDNGGKVWFAISAYVGLICLYSALGAFMFRQWEWTWSFVHSFHFAFNLIITVGLGDIVVVDYFFLSLIVVFTITGLSVVTMCIDIASTHLKAYFTRLHYSGRPKRFLGINDELKEIMTMLTALRKKKGSKASLTWDDVRTYLDNELRDRPFEPLGLLGKLRFIDDNTASASFHPHIYGDSVRVNVKKVISAPEEELEFF